MSPSSHLNPYKRLVKKPDNDEDTASTSCSSKSQTSPRSYGTPSVLGRIQSKFLAKHLLDVSEQPTPHSHYGLDMAVFDSICDRLKLTRDHVKIMIVRLADLKEMEYTRIAQVFQSAVEKRQAKEETHRAVQVILLEIKRLAAFLKPTPGSVFAEWRPKINERLKNFLAMVAPLIAPLFRHIPESTGNTGDEKHRQLSYEFEVMLEQRLVPLVPYGITPTLSMLSTFPVDSGVTASPLDEKASDVEDKSEPSFALTKMQAKLRRARAQNLQLEAANRFLVRRNK